MGNWAGQKADRPGGTAEFRGANSFASRLPHKLRGGTVDPGQHPGPVTSNPTPDVPRQAWTLGAGTDPGRSAAAHHHRMFPRNWPREKKLNLTGSLRQRMEQHRANPACANCHAKMDPAGLLRFEKLRRDRRFFAPKDGEFPIETAGVLPRRKKRFQGPWRS